MKETLDVINQMQHDSIIGMYAIGGAVGATFYIEPVSTMDIDIFVSFEESKNSPLISLSPIYTYLKKLGYEIRGEYIMIEGWPIQFLPPSDDLGEEALAQAISTTVDDISTRVMTAEHLLAIALQVGRAKDYLRIIQFIEADAFNTDKLTDILYRHGLSEKWGHFKKRYLTENEV